MKKIFVYVLLCLGLLASCTSGTEGLDQSEVFTVSLDSIDKDCKGGKAEIVVESLCSWTISDTENVDWFTLSATKGGTGNSVITVDIAENKTPEEKRATIVVGNKLYGFSHKITISQEAGNPFITPSKSQIESTAAGSSMTIDIDSNVEFTASSSESWCKVNPTSLESGKNSVDITIDANPKTESRSAVVTFSNEQYDYSTTISVSQVAFVPNLEIDSEAIKATSEGTAKSVAVTSNISWSASCDADWVTLTPTYGEKGSSTLKITVAANTKTVAREAVVTISNSEYKIEKQIAISQEAFGPSLDIDTESITASVEGVTKSIAVTSNISWSASCDADWVTITPANGEKGSSTLKITVAANTKTVAREAIVTISNSEYKIEKQIAISQEAFGPSLNVDTESMTASVEGDTKSIAVTSNISWSASCNADWVTITPTNGEKGNSTLKITVAANTKTVAREAVVTISNSEYKTEKQIAISQEAFGPSLNIDKESITASAEGVTKSIAVTSNISWSASCNADWVTITPTNGEKGNSTLKITVAANIETIAREAVITISNSEYNLSKEIAVTQAEFIPIVEIDAESINISSFGDSQSIAITSNISWDTQCDAEWVSISAEVASVTITATMNDMTEMRTANVRIFNDKYSIHKEITITQDVCPYIGYTSTDGMIVNPNSKNAFGANILSNTYRDGKGIIIFDDEVTVIGANAFSSCRTLASITIPNSVTEIGLYAFDDCSSLTSVTIPNSITTIGDYAFRFCSSLTSVTIPDSVTWIGSEAFGYCRITDVYYLGDLSKWCKISFESFGANPLSNHAKLHINNQEVTDITIPSDITSIGNYTFNHCSSLTSVTIPYSVTTIGNYAFCCCSLTSVTIPKSVTKIGDNAFSGCSSLTSVTIPNSVTEIGSSAFSGCSSLTSVTIPNSVTKIKHYTFHDCTSLTSVTIPYSVTTIGNSAFCYCSSLTSITIPYRVTTIESYAFGYCSILEEIYCKPTTPPTGDHWMFDHNAPGRKIYVPASNDDSIINAYKVADGWKEYANYIEEYDFNK